MLSTQYVVSGWQGVSSRCGLTGALPNIAPEPATNTRVCSLWSRTAYSSAAVAPAIAANVGGRATLD